MLYSFTWPLPIRNSTRLSRVSATRPATRAQTPKNPRRDQRDTQRHRQTRDTEDTEEATADHIYDIVESEVESYLLGTSRRRTTSELVERASVTLDEATDLWVALGFPIPRERDGARFTDADADATHTLAGLVEDGIIDAEMRLALARTIGQATARLAEWQIDVLTSEILAGLENLGDDPSDRQIRKLARRTAERTVPALEHMQNYVWRRHMAAAMRRSLAATRTDPAERDLVVGFADMVGYTGLTRHLARDELTDLLEAFESTTTQTVTNHTGWVIKNVGDEVMFADRGARPPPPTSHSTCRPAPTHPRRPRSYASGWPPGRCCSGSATCTAPP